MRLSSAASFINALFFLPGLYAYCFNYNMEKNMHIFFICSENSLFHGDA
jgi:uncharacterized membrane protein